MGEIKSDSTRAKRETESLTNLVDLDDLLDGARANIHASGGPRVNSQQDSTLKQKLVAKIPQPPIRLKIKSKLISLTMLFLCFTLRLAMLSKV